MLVFYGREDKGYWEGHWKDSAREGSQLHEQLCVGDKEANKDWQGEK